MKKPDQYDDQFGERRQAEEAYAVAEPKARENAKTGLEKLATEEIKQIQEAQGADSVFDVKRRPDAGKADTNEKAKELEDLIIKKAGEMKGLNPAGPAYREKEEQWNLLRKEFLALEAESAQKASGASSGGQEKPQIPGKPQEARTDMESQLKSKPKPEAPKEKAEISKTETRQKGKSIVSQEAIENFIPIEQRVNELKESMVVGAHNKDMEEGKNEKPKFWEKTKEAVSRGKEWLTRPWLRERLKGFATGGLWELWQGGKFQISARMTGKELLRANEKMKSNKNQFTYDDAVAVHNKLVESGNLDPVDRAKFEQVANTIRREKNMQYIDLVTAQARTKMKERLNWGGAKFTRGLEYRDRDGNKVQFDDAKLDQMMLNLRTKLIAMQDGAVKEDVKGFTGIIKKDLDPKYWKHYQYAAVDALLWTKGYLALNKYFAANAIPGSSEAVPPVSGAEQIITPPTGMDGTIWNTVDQVMRNPPSNMGLEAIPHPSLEQLTEASKYVVKGNGVGVDIWNIKGAPLDTLMQQGHPLDMNPLFDHWKEIVKLGAR